MFGFGVGKIELKVPKNAYAPGETIEGTLLLTVKKPVKARGLFITLFADQEFREQYVSGGKPDTRIIRRKIYNFQQQLDTEKEYPVAETTSYPFSVAMPPEAGAPQTAAVNPMGGFLTVSLGALQIGGGSGPIGLPQWALEGYLDLPYALDVKATVALGVHT